MNDNRNDYYVYAWLRPSGEVFYIGKGRGNRDRAIKTNNPVFERILDKIVKAGSAPSVVRLHENLAEDTAFKIECEEIARYGRRNNGTGILANLTDGGEGTSGRTHSVETKAKIRAIQVGRTASEETRSKMSNAHTGKKASEEHRINISFSLMGKSKSAEHCARIGASKTNPSAETREKIGSTHRGKSVSQDVRARTALSIHMKPPASGYKGVNFDVGRGKWLARIKLNGKPTNLGRYPTAEGAAMAYDAAAIDAWGVGNCYINLPLVGNANAQIAA